ncbi:aminotransferase class I/II-fold pyridoxal phosphate-dependent enzyme [Octadecabacter sp.]|nr:aminotransferase class I/II-fold pyridoxal phosphate-dependent enzyme [Octadecabacter sp.]
MTLKTRGWVPENCETRVQEFTAQIGASDTVRARLDELVIENRDIHEAACFNLNPATNVMNPRAEAMLSSGIGSRPSLGYPGDKYEMGLEAIEEIEVISAALCAEVFNADFAEIRVPSGAIANLYGFMATCKPGDTIIVPPASVGGHVTHHMAGCAGLYGLRIIAAPVLADGYTIDPDALMALAKIEKPKLITVGASLNLYEHPVAEIRAVADAVGAKVMFDAAHQCGIIAGKAWRDPLADGAHFMTMSTYKSLGGPAGGLIVTNDPEMAEAFDAIAFPGMTANFDAAKPAAMAITMLDWRDHGHAYAAKMIEVAQGLAAGLKARGVPVFETSQGATSSHQFAIQAAAYGGGQTASKHLRKAGFLACGIGLPIEAVAGDMNGLRIGTPELVRWGVDIGDVDQMCDLIAEALESQEPSSMAPRVRDWRETFRTLHYIT